MANPMNDNVTKTNLLSAKTRKMFSKLPSGQALENYLQTYPVDKLDVIFATTIRLFEVFSSVFANGTYDPNPRFNDNNHRPIGVDGNDYGLSFYDRLMYKEAADGTLHASPAGIAINGAAGGLALLAGFGRGIYDAAHKNNLKSRKRLKAMMARHLTDEEMEEYLKLEQEAEARIKESIQQFVAARNEGNQVLSSKNISQEAIDRVMEKMKAAKTALLEAREKLGAAHKIEEALNNAKNTFNTTENAYHISLDEKNRHQIERVNGFIFNKTTRVKPAKSLKESVFSVISKLDKHRYTNRLAQPFTWMTNQSMWYWLAWFLALAIVGPIAIFSPPVMLGLALAVAIIGGGLSLWKGFNRHTLHTKHVDQREKIIDILEGRDVLIKRDLAHKKDTEKNGTLNNPKDEAFRKNILNMHAYYKNNRPDYAHLKTDQRAAFLLRKYEKYTAADQANMNTTLKAWQSKTFMDFEHTQNLKKIEKIREKHLLQMQEQDIPDAPKSKGIRDYLLSDRRRSRLARHLYVVNNVIAAISFGIVIPFFITQLLAGFVMGGAILALHAGVAVNLVTLGGITGALNSATATTIWGAIWAAKNGITTFITQRRARLSYADRVKNLLKTNAGNGETNEQRFDRLQRSFDKKMAYLKNEQAPVYEAMKKRLVGCEQWSATNHHYHEKQREKATPWTRVKQVLNRGFEVFGGSQTGILVTRVLFLFGCVFVSALAGAALIAVSGATFGLAPIIFTAMAGLAGGLLGGNRLLKYHLRSRQEHRKNFLNTFDDRVKFLEQKNEELDKLLGIPREAVAIPAVPANDQGNDPAQVAPAVAPNPAPGEVAMPAPAANAFVAEAPNNAMHIPTTQAHEYVDVKPIISMSAIKHSLLFKPAVAMDNTVEKAFEAIPRAVASPAA